MKTYSYKGKKIVADSKKDAIQKIVAGKNTILDFEEYQKKFDEYWKPRIDDFKKKANKFSEINYDIWLTDCGSDYDKFAHWSFDNDFFYDKSPISVDWWFESTGDSESDSALITLVENIILKEPYDNMSSSPFWREDYFDNNTNDILSDMKAANELVATYKKLKD